MTASGDFIKALITKAMSGIGEQAKPSLPEPYRLALQLLKAQVAIEKELCSLTDEQLAPGRREELDRSFTGICEQMETAGVLKECAKIHGIVADSDDLDMSIETLSEDVMAILVRAGA